MDATERERLRRCWSGTGWRHHDGTDLEQQPLVRGALVIGAWNPWSLRLGEAINRARDAVLEQELAARELSHGRLIGGTGDWWEEFWSVDPAAADGERLFDLLAVRYQQWAGLIQRDRLRLRWWDGQEEPLP
jgi:hypothetical protein